MASAMDGRVASRITAMVMGVVFRFGILLNLRRGQTLFKALMNLHALFFVKFLLRMAQGPFPVDLGKGPAFRLTHEFCPVPRFRAA